MPPSIFTLPADRVDAEVLARFLAQANPEATVLEYKRELNVATLRTIAAMANSSGGIVLLGVPEKKGTGLPGEPIGIALAERDRLVSQCFAKLEPPFEPEIIPVSLDRDDCYVLATRSDEIAGSLICEEPHRVKVGLTAVSEDELARSNRSKLPFQRVNVGANSPGGYAKGPGYLRRSEPKR